MNDIRKKLLSIYDSNEPALISLQRLVRNSSTLAGALQISQAPTEYKVQEMLAQNFLNCYCAGFCAGVDFKSEGH